MTDPKRPKKTTDLMAALQQEVQQAREENARVRQLRQQLDRARKDVELNKAGWAAEIERTKALESGIAKVASILTHDIEAGRFAGHTPEARDFLRALLGTERDEATP